MSQEPQADGVERSQPLMHAAFEQYVRRRADYYADTNRLLEAVLKKDALMYALRGVETSDDFVEAAFAAHESSSEETMWGNAWQQAIAEVAPHTVGGGDLRTERDGTLWIIQVKSSIEQNYNAEAQDLRVLQTKLKAERDHHPNRRNVKAMLGIIRGQEKDEWRMYRARADANHDIDGFQYQYMVGSAFRRWISAELEPAAVLNDMADLSRQLQGARRASLSELKQLLRARLDANGLEPTIEGVLSLTAS